MLKMQCNIVNRFLLQFKGKTHFQIDIWTYPDKISNRNNWKYIAEY